MSDSPPKPGSDPASTEATKSPPTSSSNAPEKIADSPVKTDSSTSAALDDAAKAMAAVSIKSDLPAAAADAIVKNSATATSPPPEAPKAEPAKPAVDVFQLPANASGMHQQYVAPGVTRQSFMSSSRFTVIFLGVIMAAATYMLFAGGRDSFGINSGGQPITSADPTSTAPLVDDTSHAFPNPNNVTPPPTVPQADFTVNAVAIGADIPPAAVSARKPDAGNKGGYAQEMADLAAAEAMVDKDPAKALQMVDQHDADYPRGMADPEARVVRVEAYAKKGDDVKALELGDEFLEDYPHSPRAGRVVSIVETLKNKLDSGK